VGVIFMFSTDILISKRYQFFCHREAHKFYDNDITIQNKSLIIDVRHHKVYRVHFFIKFNLASRELQKSPYCGRLLHTFFVFYLMKIKRDILRSIMYFPYIFWSKNCALTRKKYFVRLLIFHPLLAHYGE
jgi:hypothetical protein